jgi:hypothetical protein
VALAERFLAHFDLDRRERLGADAALDARLDEALRAARAAIRRRCARSKPAR